MNKNVGFYLVALACLIIGAFEAFARKDFAQGAFWISLAIFNRQSVDDKNT